MACSAAARALGGGAEIQAHPALRRGHRARAAPRSRRSRDGRPGFLGPNGAGKTTTTCAASSASRPRTRAEVRWDGAPIDAAARLRFLHRRRSAGLYPRMRVADQLVCFGRQPRSPAADAKRRTAALLERFRLADRAASKVEDLSHGNQQAGAARRGAGRPRAARPR
ncbi:MAG: ATP-binding cassette domain-containing protein [Chloroflexota bacterium]